MPVHPLPSESHREEAAVAGLTENLGNGSGLVAKQIMMTDALRLSRFAHFVGAPAGYVGVFNALNLAVVAVESRIAEILKTHSELTPATVGYLERECPSLLPELQRQRIVVQNDDQAGDDLAAAREHLRHAPIGILYLLLTDACNLNCQYCYFEAGMPVDYQFSKMPPAVAQRSIDLFAKVLQQPASATIEEPQIILYGGEPFLNWETMSDALSHISDRLKGGALPANTSVTINSNGTAITDHICEVLQQFPFVTVAVSVDGPKELHDVKRKDLLGHGTFRRTDAGIRRLQKAGIKVGLCCTLSTHNLNRAKEILLWLRETYGVTSLGFNILISPQHTEPARLVYADNVADAIIACFKTAREEGIYEDRIMRKVRSFVQGKINFYDCGGCGGQLVIAPNGQIGVCQAYCGTKKYFTEFSASFDPYTHPYWQQWRTRSPIGMDQCADCIALGNCGGGCAYAAENCHGNIRDLDDIFCVFSKKVIQFLVSDLVNNMLRRGQTIHHAKANNPTLTSPRGNG